ncbi:unnamed protein product [Rotaria sp. Silwood2]|nr:unnamed protein product [Rotaria sp. Silwood2]CAF2552722.1 unnamed protein product [Rotaria sp. Silwood2]CAF2803404.1 unnamed protein product [Rotaria sp. Silwood2]CAF2960541.1 unnamed protein product [Rotaria sp. Silwood2]CAF4407656.1 unnamed protein product [Rotaria sp. Silwood2]
MYTSILNPNSSSSINTNINSISSSQIHLELSKILLKHDSHAIRLYDFINHVKIFFYNSNEFRWENNSYIEGNLFIYERKSIINNQIYPSYAFAIINEKQKFIQEITSDMSHYADKLRLFYEIVINDKCEVFCLYFVNENECQRLSVFITQFIQSIRNFKHQQSPLITTNDLQATEKNEQLVSENLYQQQTPTQVSNSTASQIRSSRQTLTQQQSTPTTNSNNTEDPTLSLKRLLNISRENDLHNGSSSLAEKNPINFIPPSAFESVSSINVEHFRNVLLHLVQNNDHFFDIIHQACLNDSIQ